jgi:acetyltransferase-like isoleucine patch superfamily enzyme
VSLLKRIFKILLKGFSFFNILYNYFFIHYFRVNDDNFFPISINGRIFIRNYGTIDIGKNFKANSGKNKNPIGGDVQLRLIVGKDALLQIGKNVGISNSTVVVKNKVEIHDYVKIGGGCRIWDSDFHDIDPERRKFEENGESKVKTKPIIIKENAFIGGSSIILKGVTVGHNSVIGAGSVVTKSVPDNEIWAGNPAKFIRKLL